MFPDDHCCGLYEAYISTAYNTMIHADAYLQRLLSEAAAPTWGGGGYFLSYANIQFSYALNIAAITPLGARILIRTLRTQI